MSTKHGSLSSQAVRRLQGGQLILKDFNAEEIADILDVSESAVYDWKRKLKRQSDELHALARKKGSGRTPKLSDEQKSRLKELILAGAVAAGYPCERWTSRMVADLIAKTFGVELSPRTARRVMRSLGLSPQLPVVKAVKHDDEAVLEWAKRTWKRLKKKQNVSASP